MILVDTNIAARAAEPAHRFYQTTMNSLEFLAKTEGEEFAISTHSLYELYFIFTKPTASNGFGFSAAEAADAIRGTLDTFEMLPETLTTFQSWQLLVAKYSITNRRIFDAKLVASMIENSVTRLLTYNDADFKDFSEIQPLNPFEVLGVPRLP